MLMLITYDISLEDAEGQARLRRVAKLCLDYGVRVQYSVFECDIAPDQWVVLKDKLLKTYNPETDSLRFYHLGSKWRRKVEHHGAKPAVDVFKNVFIVSASAVNYRHEQKNLPKRYQSRAICASPSPAGKCP